MKKIRLVLLLLVTLLLLSSITFADTLKKGSQGTDVKTLQQQLKIVGFFKGTITGYFGSETEAAVKAFQTKHKMTSDGIVGKNTAKVLADLAKTSVTKSTASTTSKTDSQVAANTEKSTGKVELLDWWTEASKIFSIGTIAKVTDVKTGKTFNLVRTYGANHADCEALTAKDTATMKEIWGGQWSWERRPVVIQIGDQEIAASIAAMPHAGVDSKPASATVSSRSGGYGRGANLDKIKNNKMSGVVDVHFLNSRTHGTNKVDPKHQAAIKAAAASGEK